MSKEQNPFDNSDFNKAIPVEWNSTHIPYCKYFRCKLPIFRHLLANEVPTNVKAKVSKAWVMIANRRIAAYATYRADLLQIIDSKGRAKKIILQDAAYTSVPR